ncbi:HD domain-containing protein [Ornithinibacillus sp. BX22]|uniref:HD domain-containing protein n=1 Tax=Ornithinibacillus hominis TaxID=2763055 RepID=A0A923RI77_9BACI|nr:HD domain-containing protein [Ornithinibacillus hominis]MBC5637025.1 HD domain-containing protein [Ornithinibacillus hominis]
MNQNEQILAIQAYCQKLFGKDSTGHDFFHLKRVARLASQIAKQENANTFICVSGAWLHDVGDHKLFDAPARALNDMDKFLTSIQVSKEDIQAIHQAIENISFSKGKIPSSIEGKIIQDADRIDAIGAIGIARTFAYGGAKGRLMYHDVEKQDTSLQHFYDKILHLKDTLHTDAAKKLAEERHAFVEAFIEQFLEEWG